MPPAITSIAAAVYLSEPARPSRLATASAVSTLLLSLLRPPPPPDEGQAILLAKAYLQASDEFDYPRGYWARAVWNSKQGTWRVAFVPPRKDGGGTILVDVSWDRLTPESDHEGTNRADQESEYEQAEEHEGHVRAEELRPPYQVPSRNDHVDAHRGKDQPQPELDLAQQLPCADGGRKSGRALLGQFLVIGARKSARTARARLCGRKWLASGPRSCCARNSPRGLG